VKEPVAVRRWQTTAARVVYHLLSFSTAMTMALLITTFVSQISMWTPTSSAL
jgi:hypothetical protein